MVVGLRGSRNLEYPTSTHNFLRVTLVLHSSYGTKLHYLVSY